MQSASFVAQIGDKRVALSSLNAVKKAIDKYLDAKAAEVVLKFPVVIRITKGRFFREDNDDPDKLIHGIITGVDAESKRAVGLEIPKEWNIHTTLPDTPANVKRLEVLIAAELAESKAKKAIEGRTVGLSFAGHGRKPNSYSEAVELLKQSYERAKKAESAD
jgi:hypothetical protein